MHSLLSSSLLFKNLKIKMYIIIILPLVLYGCETRSLIVGEKRRLRLFGNKVLRRIYRTKRDEVTRERIKLHNEERNDVYCILNTVRVRK